MIKDFLNENFSSEQFFINTPLSNFTFTKIGGKADFLVFPNTVDEFSSVLRHCHEHNLRVTVLGNASNVLISSDGIRGVVVVLTRLKGVSIDSFYNSNSPVITCAAGESIIDVSRFALSESLTGLEFACGIPGSIGGAIYMNAGAYGGEVKDVFLSAKACTKEGKIITLTKEDLNFSYRTSSLQEKELYIAEVSFVLEKGSYQDIKNKMDELTNLRESKQPLEYPSCGSVFKRPEGHFAGQLIQEAGLQGYRIGGAEVSTKHAGFIVNIDNATSDDYLGLIEHVQKVVFEKFGVQLEREVRIIS